MLRRSFLKGAAALAAVPLAPISARAMPMAQAPVEIVAPVVPYRSCTVRSASGIRVFDANGTLRMVMGMLNADDPAWASEKPWMIQYHA